MRRWSRGATVLKATVLATRLTARFSERLSGWWAARLWFTPWTVPLNERALAHQRTWLSETERTTFDTPVGRLAGFSAGEGPAVLLVHGWGERAGDLGAFIAPLREAGFRVVGLDLPAHGANAGTQTDLLEVAAALSAVVDEVGPVHGAIAHSMGAHGLVTAIGGGLGVERVALISPAVRLQRAMEPFAQIFGLPERAVRGLQKTIERRYGKTVWDDLAADRMAQGSSTEAIVFHDREDPQIDVQDARLLVSAWPGAELVETEGLGHGRIMRDPGVIARSVDFLARARSAVPGSGERVAL
jgi:pimeloyl-ACP methyl ester carboxylesterase